MKRLLVLTGILSILSSCAYAESNGRIRLAASNVAGDNWAGAERDATDFSITADYAKAYGFGSSTVNFVGKAHYSQQSIGDKRNISGDDIKFRVDMISEYRDDVKFCTSIKNASHIKRGGAVTCCKAGVARAKSHSYKWVDVISVRKASISVRAGDNTSVGLLLETDILVKHGDWSVAVEDSDWFITGFNKCNFEIPIRVEYCPKILFVSYDVLVRGDNLKAGVLKALKTGIKYQF